MKINNTWGCPIVVFPFLGLTRQYSFWKSYFDFPRIETVWHSFETHKAIEFIKETGHSMFLNLIERDHNMRFVKRRWNPLLPLSLSMLRWITSIMAHWIFREPKKNTNKVGTILTTTNGSTKTRHTISWCAKEIWVSSHQPWSTFYRKMNGKAHMKELSIGNCNRNQDCIV